MTRTQALSVALKMREEGHRCDEIAQRLASEGYTSSRTGKPLGPAGVNRMLLDAGARVRSPRSDRKRKTRRPGGGVPSQRVPRGRSSDARLKAVKSILSVNSMDPEERVTLALLVLE